VLLPQVQGQVRLSQAGFVDMVRPALEDSVALLRAAIDSTVLLVGGSAPIPLVTELLSSALGRPVVTVADPEASVALGAVLALRSEAPTLVAVRPGLPATTCRRCARRSRPGADCAAGHWSCLACWRWLGSPWAR
jgi:hypothetical protein